MKGGTDRDGDMGHGIRKLHEPSRPRGASSRNLAAVFFLISETLYFYLWGNRGSTSITAISHLIQRSNVERRVTHVCRRGFLKLQSAVLNSCLTFQEVRAYEFRDSDTREGVEQLYR